MAFPIIDNTKPEQGVLAQKSIFRSQFTAIKTLIQRLFQNTGGVKFLQSDQDQTIDVSDEDNYGMFRTGSSWSEERTITFTGVPQDGAIIEISNNSGQDIFLTNDGVDDPLDVPLDPFRIQAGTGVTLQTYSGTSKLIKTRRWWETSSLRVVGFGGSKGDLLAKKGDDDFFYGWLGLNEFDQITSLDEANDLVMVWDATDGKHKGVKIENLPSGGGGGSDDQIAAEVSFTPAGGISASDVQAALEELDTEKAAASHTHTESDITDLGSYQSLDALLTSIAALSDPGADRILFWDNSAGDFRWLTAGSNLTISGTTLDAAGSGGSSTLSGLDDVTLDSVVNGEVLVYASGDWINRTLAEAGIAAASHGHTAGDISGLATVATSGSYSDLSDQPSLFSGSYDDLTDKPTLFSGSYDDLSDKPTLFSGAYADLTGKPTLGTAADNNEGDFAAAAHTHTEADITDLGNYSEVGHSHTESDITDLGSYANISGTPADTYIAVWTGADTIEGLSNLRWDGATLALTDTSDDANEGPVIRFHRNRQNPADNDVIGVIDFDGENSADERTGYARIVTTIDDITDATEDGKIDLDTRRDGTLTTRLSIQSNVVLGTADLDLDGNDLILDTAGNAKLYENASNDIRLQVAGSDRLAFQETKMIMLGGLDLDLDGNLLILDDAGVVQLDGGTAGEMKFRNDGLKMVLKSDRLEMAGIDVDLNGQRLYLNAGRTVYLADDGTHVTINGLPESDPGGSGRLWVNGGTLSVT